MITVTEDYVSFEIAKLLKEKKFDIYCHTAYETMTSEHHVEETAFSDWGKLGQVKRPTLQMAMKWLRQVHNIFIAINMVPKIPGGIEDKRCYFFQPYKNRIFHNFPLNYSIKIYSTYEQACEAAIKYCLENLI